MTTPADTIEPTAAKTAPNCRAGTAVEATRAMGVTFGPPLLLDLVLGGSVALTATALASPGGRNKLGQLPNVLALLGTALAAGYVALFRPWFLRWGATRAEIEAVMPGDELVPDPAVCATRAVTVEAPVEAVWPWVAQLGQDRAGFYSYAWLENLAGCQMPSADRIHPEWQTRAVGETVKLHPLAGLKVAVFEPNRAFILEQTWGFVLEPLGPDRCRLIARSRSGRGPRAIYDALLVELPHFIMERRMLLTIKALAERAWNEQREPGAEPAVSVSRAS